VFETTIMMYDPNLAGHLENIEGIIDQEITNILLQEKVYVILLVFARISKMKED